MQELNIWLESIEKLHGKLPEALKRSIHDHYCNYWDKDRLRNVAKSYWLYESYEEFVKIDQPYLKELPKEVVCEIYEYLMDDIYYMFH